MNLCFWILSRVTHVRDGIKCIFNTLLFAYLRVCTMYIHMNTSMRLYAYLRFSINIENVLSAENFHPPHIHKPVVDRKRVRAREKCARTRKQHFNSESERNILFLCDNEKYRKKLTILCVVSYQI